MPKIFATCCALLVVMMAVANYEGYMLTSLFTTASAGSAQKAASHYHK